MTAMSKNIRSGLRLVLPVLLLGICGGGAISRIAAQSATATILGTVTDTSGAAIPNAAVQVQNTGTGITESTVSVGQGRFRVPDLAVGDYQVRASKMGFSTGVHSGITLTVGAKAWWTSRCPSGSRPKP